MSTLLSVRYCINHLLCTIGCFPEQSKVDGIDDSTREDERTGSRLPPWLACSSAQVMRAQLHGLVYNYGSGACSASCPFV